MHIIIIGGKGMLGSDLVDAVTRRGGLATVLDLPEFDITKPAGLAGRLPAADAVINCAAYTRVDDAELDRDLCWKINAEAAGHVASACAERGLPLLHLSTDYVFDGTKGAPYREDDPVAPLNHYGASKLEGERLVQQAGGAARILRTQSLFGLRGRNFVRAILGQLQQGKTELRVVADQVSAPTYTRHLAEALLDIAQQPPAAEIVNVSATGACSWWEFARAIVDRTRPGVRVEKRSSAEMNYPARRPAFSVLDPSRLRDLIGRTLPGWQDGLAAYLAEEPLVATLHQH